MFAKVMDITIERQKRDPLESQTDINKSLWLPLQKNQEYKPSTKQEFKSLLLKIIYCLIEDKDLENYGWYDVDRELDSLYNVKMLISVEEFIRRLLDIGGISKKRMQATINFYTRAMKLPDYKIPAGVELPKDKEKKKRLTNNKTIDLRDDFIIPMRMYIENEIIYKNYYTNQGLVRGAIAFNIIKGTGMRITNAYQIQLDDLKMVYEKGEHKVTNLITKHSKVNFCYVKCIDKKALKMALELYSKVPVDFLNKISSKSPTRFHDITLLVNSMSQWCKKTDCKKFTSNMIRNFVADDMLTKGVSINKTSKMMNHASVSATRHYLNKFHPGPIMHESDSSDSESDFIIET